jgi:hypothetical protein
MEWTLRLVGTEMDGQSRSFDVMEISRPDDLSDFANLGLTLAEGKQLLVQVQQEVVAAQARHQAIVSAGLPVMRRKVPHKRLAASPGCDAVW